MRILTVILFFLALAAAFLSPLNGLWSTHIPGGLQDTRLFLWNAWWWREALATGISPYHTSLLFHPFGVSLLTHDMPLWNALVTTALANLSWITAINIGFVLTWALAGIFTYALAKQVTGSRAAAVVAGIYVMSSSYLSARAMQNWGQFNLFGIPLFLWLLIRARATGRGWWLAGLALAWTAACHLYFLIYSGLILLAVMLADLSPIGIRAERGAAPAGVRRALLVLACISGVIGLFIGIKPGVWMVGGMKLSMQTPTNVLLVFWLSVAAYVGCVWRLRLVKRAVTQTGRSYALLIGVAAVALLPLIVPSVRMSVAGDYPRQTILWKTHPKGANLLAPFFPNSQHVWWGDRVSRWYTDRQLNQQEQASSLGWVFLAVIFLAGGWTWRNRWLLLGGGATVLALGTHLYIAQWNTWLPLPFYVLRLLPLVGNVRIPERWMAVAMTALAVVLAQMLIKLCRERGWNLRAVCAVVGALILLENWPGVPAVAVPLPDAAEVRLKEVSSRGVLPVPLYIGDSSKGAGNSIPIAGFAFPIDDLLIQTTHRKPMTGGYIGRISRQLITTYKESPLIGGLIEAEETLKPVLPLSHEVACAEAHRLQIDHLLVTDAAVPPAAWQFLQNSLPLERLEQGDMRELYAVRCSVGARHAVPLRGIPGPLIRENF